MIYPKILALMALLSLSINSFGQESKVQGRALDYIQNRPLGTQNNIARIYAEAYSEISMQQDLKTKKTTSWTPIGPFGDENLWGIGRLNDLQIHPNDTNIWFACYGKGGLWKSSNAGASWTPLSNGLPFLNSTQLAINPNNPDEMYLLTGDVAYFEWSYYQGDKNHHYAQGVFKTTDGGQNWIATDLSFEGQDFQGEILSDIRIHPTHSTRLCVVGKSGIFTSSDAGSSWTKQYSGEFRGLEMNPENPNTLLAVGYYSHFRKEGKMQVLKSLDFGKTWNPVKTDIAETGLVVRMELAYAPSDTNLVYAIATDTTYGYYATYKSSNGGDSFTMVNSVINDQLNILGWNFVHDTGGQAYYDLAIAVDKQNSQRVWIGGVNLWESTDGCENFLPVNKWSLNYYRDNALHSDVHQIKQHPTNNSVFVCNDGGLSRSFNIQGVSIEDADNNQISTTWQHYTSGLNVTEFYRLSVNSYDTSHIIAGAQDNSTVFRDETGFINISGGDGMESMFLDEFDTRISSSQNGNFRIFKGSFDFPSYVNPPEGEVGAWVTPVSAIGGDVIFGFSNVYSAYTGKGQLTKLSNFQSTSGFPHPKETRSMVTDPFLHVIYLGKFRYFDEHKNSFVDTSTSELWASFAPNSWVDISTGLPEPFYPVALELNQSNNQEVWMVNGGFESGKKIYHSIDGGQSWENMSFNLPNINVTGIRLQQDETQNLYLSTDIGVFYLSRWEDKWKYYSTGLPKVEIQELEIQYEAKMLRAATFGRGIWEVPLVDQLSTSIEEEDLVEVQISPNPTSDVITLTSKQAINSNNIRIIDITGKELEVLCDEQKSLIHKVDVSSYPSGQYFMIIYINGIRMVEKFQKF